MVSTHCHQSTVLMSVMWLNCVPTWNFVCLGVFLWANDALDQVSDKMSAATISWQRKSAGSLAGSHLPSVDGQQKMICRLSPLPDPNLPPTRHSLSSSLPARKRVQAVRCQTQDSRKWEQISSNDFFLSLSFLTARQDGWDCSGKAKRGCMPPTRERGSISIACCWQKGRDPTLRRQEKGYDLLNRSLEAVKQKWPKFFSIERLWLLFS